jgi:CO/xanthine dehydrogenase Mo-binding subunit
MLEVQPAQLESRYGSIYLKADPRRAISFKEVCGKLDPQRPICGSGSRSINPDEPIVATFGAQAAEVEVDLATGEVTVIRMAAAHDFGKAINPKLLTSQVYGGVEFGLGYALMEKGLFDRRTGKMLNPNLHHYRMPTSMDFPPVDVVLFESENPWFAYSAKGGAEVTNTPTPAAIGNAVAHALGGVWCNDLPMTPDKILQAIRKKNRKG